MSHIPSRLCLFNLNLFPQEAPSLLAWVFRLCCSLVVTALKSKRHCRSSRCDNRVVLNVRPSTFLAIHFVKLTLKSTLRYLQFMCVCGNMTSSMCLATVEDTSTGAPRRTPLPTSGSATTAQQLPTCTRALIKSTGGDQEVETIVFMDCHDHS